MLYLLTKNINPFTLSDYELRILMHKAWLKYVKGEKWSSLSAIRMLKKYHKRFICQNKPHQNHVTPG